MGSRANSYLGFGIVFDEWDTETHGHCRYDLTNKINEIKGVEARAIGEEEPTIFLAISDSYTQGDWDDPEVIDPEKLSPNILWVVEIHNVCKKFGIKSKEPKILMVSDYG